MQTGTRLDSIGHGHVCQYAAMASILSMGKLSLNFKFQQVLDNDSIKDIMPQDQLWSRIKLGEPHEEDIV